MTIFAQDLRTFVLADSSIAAIVSTRMYPDALPQSCTFPAIRFWQVSTVVHDHMKNECAFVTENWQIDAFATTRIAAEELAELIRLRLSAYLGAMGTSTVTGCHLRAKVPGMWPPQDGSDSWQRIVSLEFSITRTQTAPTRS